MKEEINQIIKIKRFNCIIENIFNDENKYFHEIGIYYNIDIPKIWSGVINEKENEMEFEYKWINLTELKYIEVFPNVVIDIVNGNKKQKHYIINNN